MHKINNGLAVHKSKKATDPITAGYTLISLPAKHRPIISETPKPAAAPITITQKNNVIGAKTVVEGLAIGFFKT